MFTVSIVVKPGSELVKTIRQLTAIAVFNYFGMIFNKIKITIDKINFSAKIYSEKKTQTTISLSR